MFALKIYSKPANIIISNIYFWLLIIRTGKTYKLYLTYKFYKSTFFFKYSLLFYLWFSQGFNFEFFIIFFFFFVSNYQKLMAFLITQIL